MAEFIGRKNTSKKVKFSQIASTVRYKNGVLKITQLRGAALFTIMLCLGIVIWLGASKGQKLSLMIQLSLGLTVVILLWAIYDILTTRVSFQYNPKSDFLRLKAKCRGFSQSYNGTASNYLSLSVDKQLSGDSNIDRFAVLLNYEDQQCHIPFVLTGNFNDRSKAEQELSNWVTKLELKM